MSGEEKESCRQFIQQIEDNQMAGLLTLKTRALAKMSFSPPRVRSIDSFTHCCDRLWFELRFLHLKHWSSSEALSAKGPFVYMCKNGDTFHFSLHSVFISPFLQVLKGCWIWMQRCFLNVNFNKFRKALRGSVQIFKIWCMIILIWYQGWQMKYLNLRCSLYQDFFSNFQETLLICLHIQHI